MGTKKIERSVDVQPMAVNPFRAKTSGAGGSSEAPVLAPSDIAMAVDEYVQLKSQAKQIASRLERPEAIVLAHCRELFASRVVDEKKLGGFRLQGNTGAVSFVCRAGGGSLSAEQHQQFQIEFGELPAQHLLEFDHGGVRFNGEVLRDNLDAVVAALSVLPKHVLERLIEPAGYKPVERAVEHAATHAGEKTKFQRMLQALKISNFITAA